MMRGLPIELQLFMAEQMVASHDRIRREAAADPAKHKLTTVFPRDGHTRYRFWQSKASAPNKKGRKVREVRFCWSTGRNAAGYFLTWRERDCGKGVWKRDQWAARKQRKAACALAERRCIALEKQRGRAVWTPRGERA